METLFTSLFEWLQTQMNAWVAVGLLGQSLFTLRFVFQLIHSERAQQSVVPEIFWYLSLGGGLIVLAYAVHKRDLVFILSQSLGALIYLRNIQLIWRQRRRKAQSKAQAT